MGYLTAPILIILFQFDRVLFQVDRKFRPPFVLQTKIFPGLGICILRFRSFELTIIFMKIVILLPFNQSLGPKLSVWSLFCIFAGQGFLGQACTLSTSLMMIHRKQNMLYRLLRLLILIEGKKESYLKTFGILKVPKLMAAMVTLATCRAFVGKN